MCLLCPLWMVMLQYRSIRPAWFAVPSMLVSCMGRSSGWVMIPSHLVVRWSRKFSIAPLSRRAFSTVDLFVHKVKGMFIFCILFFARSGPSALTQVVEFEQFKNPLLVW